MRTHDQHSHTEVSVTQMSKREVRKTIAWGMKIRKSIKKASARGNILEAEIPKLGELGMLNLSQVEAIADRIAVVAQHDTAPVALLKLEALMRYLAGGRSADGELEGSGSEDPVNGALADAELPSDPIH